MEARDSQATGFRAGWIALTITVLNAGLLTGAVLVAGDGVGAGIGVASLILLFTLPVLLVSLVIGVVGIRRRSGTVPAIIAVSANAVALAVSVYGFFSTQVF